MDPLEDEVCRKHTINLKIKRERFIQDHSHRTKAHISKNNKGERILDIIKTERPRERKLTIPCRLSLQESYKKNSVVETRRSRVNVLTDLCRLFLMRHRRSFLFAFKKTQEILIQGKKIKADGLKVWMQIYILWKRESISTHKGWE